jgi:hypothetical protein
LPIVSDPTHEDADGDGYTDGPIDCFGTGKVNDPRPMISDVTVYSLKGLDINNSDMHNEFLIINDTHSNQYYGGDQHWYSAGYKISAGCGTISAANIFAYLKFSSEKYNNLYHYDDLSQTNFENHMNFMYGWVMPITISTWWSTSTFGIWPLSLYKRQVVNCAESLGVTLTSYNTETYATNTSKWSIDNNYENIRNTIINGLKTNSPVSMLVAFNSRLNNTEVTWLYNLSEPELYPMNRHWVTATQLIVDDIAETDMVKVSTWGAYAYIDLDDYVNGESLYNCVVYFK